MNGDTDRSTWIVIAMIVALLFVRQQGCTAGGEPPPFKADKLTVLIVEDDSVSGRLTLKGEQDGIMRNLDDGSVRKSVLAAGGEFQTIGKTNTAPMDTPNMQAAFAVADKTNVPSIVAATPKAGVKPQSLPLTIDATKKLLAPLEVK